MFAGPPDDSSTVEQQTDPMLWLDPHGTICQFEEGEVLMSPGDPAQWMARIESGIVSVQNESGVESHTVSVGEIIGEIGLVRNLQRSAKLVAISPVSLKVFEYDVIDQICARSAEDRIRFERTLSELIAQRVPDPSGPDVGWIALVAHDRMKSQLQELAEEFHELLSGFKIVATRSTGTMLSVDCRLPIRKLVLSGPLGGDLEVGAMVARRQLEAVIFLRDGLASHAHGPDIDALVRACEIADTPCATNMTTARIVLRGLPAR